MILLIKIAQQLCLEEVRGPRLRNKSENYPSATLTKSLGHVEAELESWLEEVTLLSFVMLALLCFATLCLVLFCLALLCCA